MLSKQLRSITPAPLKNAVRKIQSDLIKLTKYYFPIKLNNYSLSSEPLSSQVFYMAKAKALSSCDDLMGDAFQWALHDTDGRRSAYQEWQGTKSVLRWLLWYRPHHFVWKRPSDSLVVQFDKKITLLGRKTWERMFRRYWFHHLTEHDRYSLPDIYYCVKIFGKVPEVAVDIGGGWGRLGMAWMAVECRSVAVVDSIEQPYILQNAYLRSIPGVAFQELLEQDQPEIDLSSFQGVSHFPFWKLHRVKSHTVDVVSAIQVLREVNRSMIVFLVNELRRILKPGGIFYVRDNDPLYREACIHNIQVSEYLLEQGFELVLYSPLVQGRDIHGIPRIFLWKGEQNSRPSYVG